METFDHLLNWKLRVGSHRFPGPDGGTCINEAALVAAGFPYKLIAHVSQMPKCFSRSICQLALRLNDEANDEERQRLLPYVTRLACADTPAVEYEREAYIKSHTECDYGFYDYSIASCFSWQQALPFNRGLEILEGALAIGRQADPLGPDEVQTRMEAARAGGRALPRAEEPTSASDKPLFSKVKSWLTLKEMEPIS